MNWRAGVRAIDERRGSTAVVCVDRACRDWRTDGVNGVVVAGNRLSRFASFDGRAGAIGGWLVLLWLGCLRTSDFSLVVAGNLVVLLRVVVGLDGGNAGDCDQYSGTDGQHLTVFADE